MSVKCIKNYMYSDELSVFKLVHNEELHYNIGILYQKLKYPLAAILYHAL